MRLSYGVVVAQSDGEQGFSGRECQLGTDHRVRAILRFGVRRHVFVDPAVVDFCAGGHGVVGKSAAEIVQRIGVCLVEAWRVDPRYTAQRRRQRPVVANRQAAATRPRSQ